MRKLTKALSERICSVSVDSYKEYICFAVIILSIILEKRITNVLVNCYGYSAGVWYETSSVVILLRIAFATIKILLYLKLHSLLTKGPKAEVEIGIGRKTYIDIKNGKSLWSLPVIGIVWLYLLSMAYNIAIYTMLYMFTA